MGSQNERTALFLLGSARAGGNTETLARRAAAGLDAVQRWVSLDDLDVPDFRDLRHEGKPFAAPEDDLSCLRDATLSATDIVIVSPLYWYSVSASVKRYLDHWSGWMRDPELRFTERMKGKTLWGVTVMSDPEPALADPLVGTLRNTAQYLNQVFGGVLIGNGSRPGDILHPDADLAAAEGFFDHVQDNEATIIGRNWAHHID